MDIPLGQRLSDRASEPTVLEAPCCGWHPVPWCPCPPRACGPGSSLHPASQAALLGTPSGNRQEGHSISLQELGLGGAEGMAVPSPAWWGRGGDGKCPISLVGSGPGPQFKELRKQQPRAVLAQSSQLWRRRVVGAAGAVAPDGQRSVCRTGESASREGCGLGSQDAGCAGVQLGCGRCHCGPLRTSEASRAFRVAPV